MRTCIDFSAGCPHHAANVLSDVMCYLLAMCEVFDSSCSFAKCALFNTLAYAPLAKTYTEIADLSHKITSIIFDTRCNLFDVFALLCYHVVRAAPQLLFYWPARCVALGVCHTGSHRLTHSHAKGGFSHSLFYCRSLRLA